jgi:BASS family bile acid:Na+ symporter
MDTTLATVALPLALAVIMFGLGLGLTPADFRRLVAFPRAVLICLGCQILALPLLCLGLVLLFDPPPALAVGMMLLAASPGGTSASLYSRLFGGNVALNITLTAVNSLIAVVTLPLVVNLSLAYFAVGDGSLGLQFGKTLQVFAVILLPVGAGMLVRARFPDAALRAERPVKAASVAVLVALIAGAVAQEAENIGGYLAAVGVPVLLFNVASLAAGYWVPRWAGVGRPEAVASCMEIGLHNSTLALAIALSPALLGSSEIAVPAAVYGVLMFFTAAVAGALVARGTRRASQNAGTPSHQMNREE